MASVESRKDQEEDPFKVELNPVEVLHELSNLPIFKPCSSSFVDAVARIAYTRRYEPGRTIVDERAAGDSLLLVHSGQVVTWLAGSRLGALTKGSSLGELLLLGMDSEWPVALTADGDQSEEAVVMSVSAMKFNGILNRFPEERAAFLEIREVHSMAGSEGTLTNTWGLFRGLSSSLLPELDGCMVTSLFFPGQHLMTEHTPCEDLFVLASGWCTVELDGRVLREELVVPGRSGGGRTREPIVFGDAALLGLKTTASATVVAQSVCQVRTLHKVRFKELMKAPAESTTAKKWSEMFTQFPEDASGTNLLGAKRCIRGLPIFIKMGVSEGFVAFLAEHLEDRIFLTGQKLIHEGRTSDRSLFVVRLGSVKIEKGGQVISKLTGEQVLGELGALGLASQRMASVVAMSDCFVQVLAQSMFLKGLELFPEEREKVFELYFDRMENEQAGGVGDSMPRAEKAQTRHRMPQGLGAVERLVQEIPFFADMSPAFAEQVRSHAKERVFMPGDRIIEEGRRGDSMFILIHGEAKVYYSIPDLPPPSPSQAPSCRSSFSNSARVSAAAITAAAEAAPIGDDEDAVEPDTDDGNEDQMQDAPAGLHQQQHMSKNAMKTMPRPFDLKRATQVHVLESGSITGEMAMLGIVRIRTATILASQLCFCWELHQQDAMDMIRASPEVRRRFQRNICRSLEPTVAQRLQSLPVFSRFGKHFTAYLAMTAEPRVHFDGETIAVEGQPSEGLIVINEGTALLWRKGIQIRAMARGSHFGSLGILGSAQANSSTLTAKETCHVLVASKKIFAMATHMTGCLAAEEEMRKAEVVAEKELNREAAHVMRTEKMKRKGSAQDARSKKALAILKDWRQATIGGLAIEIFDAWATTTRKTKERQWKKAQLSLEVNLFALRASQGRCAFRRTAPPKEVEDSRWPRPQQGAEVPRPSSSASSAAASPRRRLQGGGGGGGGGSAPVRSPLLSPKNPYCKELLLHKQDASVEGNSLAGLYHLAPLSLPQQQQIHRRYCFAAFDGGGAAAAGASGGQAFAPDLRLLERAAAAVGGAAAAGAATAR